MGVEFFMSSNGFHIQHRYLELPESFFTRVQPNPLKDPKMVCFNHDLAQEMVFSVTTLPSGKKSVVAQSCWQAWNRSP